MTIQMTEQERRANKVADILKQTLPMNQQLTPLLFDGVAEKIRRLLCLPNETAQAIRQSLISYLNRELSIGAIEAIAKKFVFGSSSLVRNLALVERNFKSGFYAVKCLSSRMVIFKVPKVQLVVELQEGVYGGRQELLTCSPSRLQVLGKVIGLGGRTWRRFHPRELVGLVFNIYMEKDENGQIKTSSFDATPEQKSKNSRLKTARKKIAEKTAGCEACHYCLKTIVECQYSTHPIEWELRLCNKCKNRVFHDGDFCLVCLEHDYKRLANILSFDENDII